MNRLAFVLLVVSACTDDPTEPFDDAVDDAGGKADAADARHYLLTSGTLARAGGGKLRCPSGEVAEACAIVDGDLETTPGLSATAEILLDEVADHPIILRGRMVKHADGRIVMRASAATRGLTSVVPAAPCYRLRPLATPAICPADGDPACFDHRFERLDSTEAIESRHLYFDDVDPTPDFWGQPTPAVQAAIDRALRTARTRPVYTCGGFETREGDAWFWGSQLFAPR